MKSMTVSQLIKLLEQAPRDAEIIVTTTPGNPDAKPILSAGFSFQPTPNVTLYVEELPAAANLASAEPEAVVPTDSKAPDEAPAVEPAPSSLALPDDPQVTMPPPENPVTEATPADAVPLAAKKPKAPKPRRK